MHVCICEFNLGECDWWCLWACNRCGNKNANWMCVCVRVWICVYSTCVTLAEVNERGVTVTEEFVIMIPASPWACVRVRGTQSLNFLCLCSKTCLSFQLCKRYAGETVGGAGSTFMFLASTWDCSSWTIIHHLHTCSSEAEGEKQMTTPRMSWMRSENAGKGVILLRTPRTFSQLVSGWRGWLWFRALEFCSATAKHSISIVSQGVGLGACLLPPGLLHISQDPPVLPPDLCIKSRIRPVWCSAHVCTPCFSIHYPGCLLQLTSGFRLWC